MGRELGSAVVSGDRLRKMEAAERLVDPVLSLWKSTRDELARLTDARTLAVPLGGGRFFEFRAPVGMTRDDLEVVLETLRLWEPRIVDAAPAPDLRGTLAALDARAEEIRAAIDP